MMTRHWFESIAHKHSFGPAVGAVVSCENCGMLLDMSPDTANSALSVVMQAMQPCIYIIEEVYP